ncbi:MAG: hypothetical protein HY695_10885 [Deltaproteobacteria bacterium]|nr:hypothetical protein [Deltaproteobacteria bacterium]
MGSRRRNPVLIIASGEELPAENRVWGTGGWLPPEQREALDWLTLVRLQGWAASVARQNEKDFHTAFDGGNRIVIIACDPDTLGEERIIQISNRAGTECLLVLARAGAAGGATASLAGVARTAESFQGRSLNWSGPGTPASRHCRHPLEANRLEVAEGVEIWATLDDLPVITARRIGRSIVATLAFHPGDARDTDGAATALLKHLLTSGSPGLLAWFDLSKTLVLRMDDPGGAQNIYSSTWCYPKLGEADWLEMGAELRRRSGRLSVGYVAGWVDDGDPSRGTLKVAGEAPPRLPGRIYDTPLVQYYDLAGNAPGTLHDYVSEYRGIQALCVEGLADVELHGYTHMHPDPAVWANAPDRYEANRWYRELGREARETLASLPPAERPLALGTAAFHSYFNTHPTTLICPGDQWTDEVLARALNLDLRLVSSYYLALRDENRFCWAQHVCAPYLDEPDSAWFDSGLPVVGYFHDRDVVLGGIQWMTDCLDRWQAAGARKFMDFRELSAAIDRRLYLETTSRGLRLVVSTEGAPPLVKPLSIAIRSPDEPLPSNISVVVNDRTLLLPVESLGQDIGRVTIPSNDISYAR